MEWKNNIIEKYPELFEKTGYKKIQFSCGEGWSWLIDNLCEKIAQHIEETSNPMKNFNKLMGLKNEDKKEEIKLKVTITTIKEKFGVLNVYCDGSDNTIWNYISFATHLSVSMCEKCGTTKHMGKTSGWIKNICYNCAQDDVNKKSWVSVDDIPIDKYKSKIRKEKILNIKNKL